MKSITVYRTWDEPMAAMALGLLKAEGIEAVKRDSGLRSSYPITVDGLGEIEIMAPEEDAARAVEILEARFSESGNMSGDDAGDLYDGMDESEIGENEDEGAETDGSDS